MPPVNFKNIDLLWPIITATAARTGKSPIPAKDDVKISARTTGSAPFIASRIITVKNHFLPITRFTFVAPVEPEPIVLMSFPVKSFTIIYPVGIDPIRYAAKITIKISKTSIFSLLAALYHKLTLCNILDM